MSAEACRRRSPLWHGLEAASGLWILLAAAALARIAGLSGPGHAGDVFAFQTWAEDAARHGLGAYYANGGDANYPPILYLLWPLAITFDGVELVFAIRMLSIPFDLALGVLLFATARSVTHDPRHGLLAAASYLLNPAVLLCGPAWGQVDGMGALPMLGAIVAAVRGRLVVAGALAVLAGLLKPQFGIAGLVLAAVALFWLREPDGVRRVALLALSALATFAVVLAPLGIGPAGYLDLIADTFGRYRYISQYGFNPWAVAFGFGDDDRAWAVLGTALAITGIGGSLWLLRRRRDLVGLLAVGVLIALAIYFIPTRVHERYLFGAIPLLAPLAAMYPRLRWPFITLSAAFFLALAYVLVTSPYRILPGPELAELPDAAISVASAIVTAVGAWTALRVLELFGIGRSAPEPVPAWFEPGRDRPGKGRDVGG